MCIRDRNVRWAFQAREAMPWGKDIPEDIFRHFVLPVRGGKENLDTARIVFYKELKERVATCESMEKAALEVNHWCHEHVIYKPTNARTRSPLATMLTAYGRCGEAVSYTHLGEQHIPRCVCLRRIFRFTKR